MESLYDKYMSYQGPVKKKLIRLLNSTGILHDKKGFLTSIIPDM